MDRNQKRRLERRQKVIALLSDGEWKTKKELGTNQELLSKLVSEGAIELKHEKTKDRYQFGKGKYYRVPLAKGDPGISIS